MKRTIFMLLSVWFGVSVFSQTTFRGQVIDQESESPLIGVSILNEKTGKRTISSQDGTFEIKLASGNHILTFSYIGFRTEKIEVKSQKPNLKIVEMYPEAIGLQDVTVTSSIAVRRKTPVALSVVTPELIQAKLGTQEFPEILKSTPSVYATKQGGGYGDSRINLRGFESANIAVMINGVPMNDMEWGGVYWSNWTGLSDVTRSLQVQRGLGASKIASPSVGGSINIVTQSTDAQKGGAFYYGIGNDSYNKMMFNVSTGLNENGWAATFLGAKAWGDGYIQGTSFTGYNYFMNISKVINDDQQISFTIFGAPQTHNQRKDKLLISEWAKQPETYRYRYNAGYGYDTSGQFKTFNYNYYHKPQISLNHFWSINEKSSLSTALYASLGYGGGYNAVGSSRSDYHGSEGGMVTTKYRRNDGTYDFAQLMEANANSTTGALTAMSASINNHKWYGLLSTYTHTLKDFEFQGGLDMRYYNGIHSAEVIDLLGADYVLDPQRKTDGKYKDNLVWINQKLTVGDNNYRNYDGYVVQAGTFAQGEYEKDDLSVFMAASFNNNTYWRIEHFSENGAMSEVVNKVGFGVKGGANYNINAQHNVFANVGYFSRTPFFSGGVFLNAQKSNAVNKDAKNEKVFSTEIGYGFRTQKLTANVNLYRTAWSDKTMIRSIDPSDPERGTVNMTGVNALHQGVELDFRFRPLRGVEITGMLSLGDWQWKNNATGYLYDAIGNALDAKGNIVPTGSPNHAFVTLNLDGIKVGNSAQTSAALGVSYKVLKSTKIGADFTFYDRNYAYYSLKIKNWGTNDFVQPWKIPAAGIVDLNMSHRFKIAKLDATLVANINNLFDTVYISDAADGGTGTWEKATVFYGFGRTMSMGLKVKF